MRGASRFAALLCALFLPLVAFATCPTNPYPGTWSGCGTSGMSSGQVAAACQAYKTVQGQAAGYIYGTAGSGQFTSCQSTQGGVCVKYTYYQYGGNGGGGTLRSRESAVCPGSGYCASATNYTITRTSATTPTCTEQGVCDRAAGFKWSRKMPAGSSWPYAENLCIKTTGANACTMHKTFATGAEDGSGTALYESTGEYCDPSAVVDAEGDSNNKAKSSSQVCITTNHGNSVCTSTDATNCGYVNGEYVCLDSVPANNCITTASGEKHCGQTAPSPPKPDNGVPGTPATPNDTLTNQTYNSQNQQYSTNVTQYFNQTTVNGSTTTGTQPTAGTGNCNPATDAKCVNIAGEWVDRQFSPPADPTLPMDWAKQYDKEAAWGSYGSGLSGKAVELIGSLSGVFPFSLAFSGPLAMTFGSVQPPVICYTMLGHQSCHDLSMWNDLFTLVRAVVGLFLIYGVWLLCLATLSKWAV